MHMIADLYALTWLYRPIGPWQPCEVISISVQHTVEITARIVLLSWPNLQRHCPTEYMELLNY